MVAIVIAFAVLCAVLVYRAWWAQSGAPARAEAEKQIARYESPFRSAFGVGIGEQIPHYPPGYRVGWVPTEVGGIPGRPTLGAVWDPDGSITRGTVTP